MKLVYMTISRWGYEALYGNWITAYMASVVDRRRHMGTPWRRTRAEIMLLQLTGNARQDK
jgi:hypothetical protein